MIDLKNLEEVQYFINSQQLNRSNDKKKQNPSSPPIRAFTFKMEENRKIILFEREQFALFVKVLLKCLQDDQQYLMVHQSRRIIVTCTQGHRAGDPSFWPLMGSIVVRLRELVGERYWRQAGNYTRFYVQRRSNQCQAKKIWGEQRPIVQV